MKRLKNKNMQNRIQNQSTYKDAMSVFFKVISTLLLYIFAIIGVTYVALVMFACIIFE